MSGNSLLDVSGIRFFLPDLSGSDLSGSDLSGSDLSGSDLSGSDLSGSDLSGSSVSSGYRLNLFVDRDSHLLTYSDGYDTRAIAQDWSAFTPERDLNMMLYSINNAVDVNTQSVTVDSIVARSSNVSVQNSFDMLHNLIYNVDSIMTNSVYFYRTAPDYSNRSYMSMHQISNTYYLSLDSIDFLSCDTLGGKYSLENANTIKLYAACNAPRILFQDSLSNTGSLQYINSNFKVSSDLDMSYNNIRNINSIYVTNIQGTGDPINVNDQILCYGGVDLQLRSIENVDNINLNTINGVPYVAGGGGDGSNWYTYPAQSSVDLSGNNVTNVGTLSFNSPYVPVYADMIDGVGYLNVDAPFHVWNYMIIYDTGGNNPGFRMDKNDGRTGTILFDGDYIVFNQPVWLQGNGLRGASLLEVVNLSTGNTANLSYVTQSYGSGETFDELAYQNVPFLYVNASSQIEIISVADIQFIDADTSHYSYLSCRDNEMFINDYGTDHVPIGEVPVASFWSKYAATATVDISKNSMTNVGTLNYFAADGSVANLPFTQYGDVMTDPITGEATVTFSTEFINDTYSVQLCYLESASTIPYITVRKVNNFTFTAEPGKQLTWTATGYVS